MQNLLSNGGSVVVGVLAIWLACRVIGSRWAWNLAVVGLVALGFVHGWRPYVVIPLAVAVLVRLLLGRSDARPSPPDAYQGPAIRDIIERQDRMHGP